MNKLLVGLDIGGTKCAVIIGFLNEAGGISIEAREAFPKCRFVTPLVTNQKALKPLLDKALMALENDSLCH